MCSQVDRFISNLSCQGKKATAGRPAIIFSAHRFLVCTYTKYCAQSMHLLDVNLLLSAYLYLSLGIAQCKSYQTQEPMLCFKHGFLFVFLNNQFQLGKPRKLKKTKKTCDVP